MTTSNPLVVRLRAALVLLYGKWEEGDDCYQDPEDYTGYLGKAFKLTQSEEAEILDLIGGESTAVETPARRPMRLGVLELLHDLEVLRQGWSHNTDIESALNRCMDAVEGAPSEPTAALAEWCESCNGWKNREHMFPRCKCASEKTAGGRDG